MRTREKTYEDYGFSDKLEAKRLLMHCRNLNPAELEMLREAVFSANAGIAPLLLESLQYGVSYQRLWMSVDVPVSEVDFYAYRRAALAKFRDMVETGDSKE